MLSPGSPVLDLIISLVFGLALLRAGSWLWHRLGPATEMGILENLTCSYGIGMALGAAVIWLAGAFALLYPALGWILLAVFLAPPGPAVRLLRKLASRFRDEWTGTLPWILVSGVFFLAFLTLLAAFDPPRGHLGIDVIRYHLGSAKKYTVDHRIGYVPGLLMVQGSLVAQLLYTWCLLLGSPLLAKLFHFQVWLWLLAGTFACGTRLFQSRTIAGLGVLLLSCNPLMRVLGGNMPGTDVLVSFYFLLAVIFLLRIFRGSPPDRNGIWMGIMMGLGFGVKMTMLIFVPALLLSLFFWSPPGTRRRALFISGLAFLLLAFPWLLRSQILTGNPVYPALWNSLGGRGIPSPPNPGMVGYFLTRTQSWGTSVGHLLLLPWHLVMSSHHYHDAGGNHLLFLCSLPFFWLTSVRRACRLVLLLGGISLAGWFFSSQEMRFLAPLLPLFALASAAVLLALAASRRWMRLLVLVTISLAALESTLVTLAHPEKYGHLDAVVAPPGPAEICPHYELYQFLSRHLKPGEPIFVPTRYTWISDVCAEYYYLDGPVLTEQDLDLARDFPANLRHLGIRYLLDLNGALAKKHYPGGIPPGVFATEFFLPYRPEHFYRAAVVYRLR